MNHSRPTIAHLVTADLAPESANHLHTLLTNRESLGEQHVLLPGGGESPLPPDITVHRVHAPLGLLPLGRLHLQHRRRQFDLVGDGRPIIEHIWTANALRWCEPDGYFTQARIIEASDIVRPADLRAAIARRPAHIVFRHDADERRWAPHAINLATSTIPPIVATANDQQRARTTTRARLNLADQHIALLLLPPLPRTSNAYFAAWATLITQKLHPTIRLLVPKAGPNTRRIQRLVTACRHDFMTRTTPPATPLPNLLAASDICLSLPDSVTHVAAPLSALAACRPILASATLANWIRHRLPGVPDGLIHSVDQPRNPEGIARTLTRLLDRPLARADVADTISDTFSPTRFVAAYQNVYAECTRGRPPWYPHPETQNAHAPGGTQAS